MLISQRTCSKRNPQNALPQYFATKLIRQQQVRLEGNHVVVRTNIRYYPPSEITILRTLNVTFTTLSQD